MLDSDAENAFLRKKYDNAKKELNRKDEVINQYAVKVGLLPSEKLLVVA